MRREELYTLKDAIDNCFNLSGLEFIHRISLIYSNINEHIAIFERNRPKTSEEYQKFQNDRSKLLDKYAAKNEDGSLTTNKHGIVLANPTAYSSSLTILEHKYYSAISKHKADTAEFKRFLESDFDFEFKLIPIKYIPSDITLGQYIGVLPLIEKELPLKKEM
jgi:hypothetical protein